MKSDLGFMQKLMIRIVGLISIILFPFVFFPVAFLKSLCNEEYTLKIYFIESIEMIIKGK